MTTVTDNTVINGDCLNVLPQIPAGSVNFVLTDPPYLANYRSRDGRTVPGDDNDAWLAPAFSEIHRVLERDSFAVSFYGWPHAEAELVLTEDERSQLQSFARSRSLPCALSDRARIVLSSADGEANNSIAQRLKHHRCHGGQVA